jgi:hypothetical protein
MRGPKARYSALSLLIAIAFWFSDSFIHYFFYGESSYEIIPADFNELWMRTTICLLVVGFGVYVDISVGHVRRLQTERYELQVRLQETLMKLLGGFVSICCVCKKVCISESPSSDKENWTSIESYISHRSELKFTHGYCPDCEAKLTKDIEERVRMRKSGSDGPEEAFLE